VHIYVVAKVSCRIEVASKGLEEACRMFLEAFWADVAPEAPRQFPTGLIEGFCGVLGPRRLAGRVQEASKEPP
jgi:hypothetical protein